MSAMTREPTTRISRRGLAAIISVVGFASVVQYITTSSLGEAVSTDTVLRSLLFASPIVVPVLRGHLGVEMNLYPSSWFLLLALWILALGPSLVASDSPIRPLFVYDEQCEDLGRLHFTLWNWIFVLGCPEKQAPSKTESAFPFSRYITLVAIWAVAIAVVAQSGQLSNYTGYDSREAVSAGGIVATALAYKMMLTDILPALALYQYFVGPPRFRWVAALVTAAAIMVIVAVGGRTHLMVAAMAASVVASSLQIRVRWPVVVGLGAAMAVLMVVMFGARASLQEASTANTATIVDAVSQSVSRVAESEQRSEVLQQVGDNISLRFGYAPQLYAAIAAVLADGPAYRGTLFEGLIRMLPSLLFPWKNALAEDASLERALWASGHFPIVDLGPTPWLQWLFELGFPLAFLGPIFYAILARLIQLLVTRNNFSSLVGGLVVFNTIVSIEHQTDALFLLARDAGLLLLVLRLSDVFAPKPKTGAV